MLTKERVEQLMSYNPMTGLFTWKRIEGRGHRELEGKVAGCLAPSGYIMLCIDRKLYRAHRVVFLLENGEFPKQPVDHINTIKNDNRRENLRLVTKQQNAFNSKPHSDSKTGIKGVYWSSEKLKYKAQLYINGKHTHLGYFNTIEEASKVVQAKQEEYHGIFSWKNRQM